jgi:phage/conjugal plasmid C-4 type zinc finger TraR family protein
MTDIIDLAAERETEFLFDALQDQSRRAGLSGKTIADSASHCIECDEPIPVARRKAVPGVQLCIACQIIKEKSKGRHAYPA